MNMQSEKNDLYDSNKKCHSCVFAPVVLFCYSRPEHTRDTLSALAQNEYASETDLIIYADAPRGSKDADKCSEVLEVIHSYASNDNFKSVKINIREENYGLARNIIDGVTEVVNRYGKIIVLEDDILTHQPFLRFMNSALDFYENDKAVMEVSGYIEPINYTGDENAILLRAPSCWGWATWKDRWKLFERNPEKLIQSFNHEMIFRFNLDGSHDFFDQIRANKYGELDTWAIFWYATIFLNKGMVVFPTQSLVCNTGFESGEHPDSQVDKGRLTSSRDVSLNKDIHFPTDVYKENIKARIALKKYYRKRTTLKGNILLYLEKYVKRR